MIALIEVPSNVATLDDAAHHGRHIADNNCLARGKDSETQIKPFYDFERRKELDGGAVVEECCYAMRKRISAIRREGDDAIIIFGGAGARSVQEWAQNTIDTKPRGNLMRLQCQSCLNSKYLWFVPSLRASLVVRTHVTILQVKAQIHSAA